MEPLSVISLVGGIVGLLAGLATTLTWYDTRRMYLLQLRQWAESAKKEDEEYRSFLGHVINDRKENPGKYYWNPDPVKERSTFEALLRCTYKGFMVYDAKLGFMLKGAIL